MSTLLQDVRFAFRMFTKTPGLTAIIVLTLALGIGANSLVFSAVRAVLLRPLPYAQPERLVQLWETGDRSGGEADWASFPNYHDWCKESKAFESLAAYRFWLFTIKAGEQAESLLGLYVTADLFHVLGDPAKFGRTFATDEDKKGSPVAVISERLWRRNFGSDAGLLGKNIDIDGRSYSVIGIMPASFSFPKSLPGSTVIVPTDLWVPMPQTPELEERGSHNYWVIGRLKPRLNLAEAQVNMNTVAANLARAYPDTNAGFGVRVSGLQAHLVESVRPAMLILMAAIGLVLLIASANIASLLLSRAESRRRETAIRIAIGASRSRLLRQNLTESLVLAAFGASAGLVLAILGVDVLRRLAPRNIPLIEETAIDCQVLVFTGVISIGMALLAGAAPAISGLRAEIGERLKESANKATATVSNLRVRNALVAGELALAIMLLVATGLLIRSFLRVNALDLGFRPDHVLTGWIILSPARYPDETKMIAFFDKLLTRIQSIPGVQAAAVTNSLPLTGVNDQGGFRIEGRPEKPNDPDGPQANRPKVSSDYFKAMGMTLLRGRLFTPKDKAGAPDVAVISDFAAQQYWPGQDPIGKRVDIYDQRNGKPVWREIVGIVRGTRHFGVEAPQKAEVYAPEPQSPGPLAMLVVHTRGESSNLVTAIRHEAASLDPEQPVFNFASMTDLVSVAEDRRRFQTVTITAFAGLALIMASVGLYGVIGFTVTQRTREIGIRMALGARPQEVTHMVVRQALTLACAGSATGLVGALALSRVISGLLYGTSPTDPVTLGSVVLLLVAVAVAASYFPARRAARTDPVQALHNE